MKPAPVQVGDIVRLTKPCAPSLIGCLAEVTSVERDKFSAVVTVPGWRHEKPTRTSFLMWFDEAAWEIAARCGAAVSREQLAVNRKPSTVNREPELRCEMCGGSGEMPKKLLAYACAACRGTGAKEAGQ